MSGNITATKFDHFPHFLSNVLPKDSCQKFNIYERHWSKFSPTEFVLYCFHKDWSDVLQLDQQDVNISIESF